MQNYIEFLEVPSTEIKIFSSDVDGFVLFFCKKPLLLQLMFNLHKRRKRKTIERKYFFQAFTNKL